MRPDEEGLKRDSPRFLILDQQFPAFEFLRAHQHYQ
jgi:hypothetical protein